MEKTANQIKIEERKKAIKKLYDGLCLVYGAENVFKVGESEFSVFVGNSPDKKEMYVNFNLTVKEFEGRKTTKREYKPYNGKEEAEKYNKTNEEKTEQKAETGDLYITAVHVDSARMLKRLRPAPQGRGYRIRKRSNHVTLFVDKLNNNQN
jgi:ribosomal protein L22